MIEIVTAVVPNTDGEPQELVDTFDGPRASWITEPSGVLVIMQSPSEQWASYAPGCWQKVRATE